MDLRPINPYYRQTVAKKRTWALLRAAPAATTYTYPYTWIEPVTDRSAEDVAYAKKLGSMSWNEMTEEQQEEYLVGLKGCMNRTDFERIENNIQILLDVLELDLSSYVDAVPEYLTETYFDDLKSNVEAIREAYFVHADTPQVPELPYNTWQKYNDIEKILADVYEVVSSQFYYYAGNEIYAGDETGLLL